jgi:hypothetical protein
MKTCDQEELVQPEGDRGKKEELYYAGKALAENGRVGGACTAPDVGSYHEVGCNSRKSARLCTAGYSTGERAFKQERIYCGGRHPPRNPCPGKRAMSEPIVLYDLKREVPDEAEWAYSPNTWKTR